ncbi:MAG: hypothetical protein U0836_00400 [Pirellulales bacterium]
MHVSLPPDVFLHVCQVHDRVRELWHASGRERASLHDATWGREVIYDAFGELILLDLAVAGVVSSKKNRSMKPERLALVLKYLRMEGRPGGEFCRWMADHRETYPLLCQQFMLLNYCRFVLLTALEPFAALAA